MALVTLMVHPAGKKYYNGGGEFVLHLAWEDVEPPGGPWTDSDEWYWVNPLHCATIVWGGPANWFDILGST